jgi:hypothetical protein
MDRAMQDADQEERVVRAQLQEISKYAPPLQSP